ncbi:hypothetical protein EVA_02512 [gut metagenome]|uniref:Uncharacterized protein n=1 Tax=gut metagenome TaxID=749906 RepID=J9GNW0_9ZZZZ
MLASILKEQDRKKRPALFISHLPVPPTLLPTKAPCYFSKQIHPISTTKSAQMVAET